MTKEKDKSFNNFVNKDEKDEEFNFEDEDITNQGFVNHESSIRDIPEEDKVTILTEEDLGLGERIDIEEILDKDILIKGIKTRPSSFYEGDYAIIQVEKDGKLYVVTTSSSILMDQINKIESKIPFRCRITKRKNPVTNRRYYTILDEDLSVGEMFEGERIDIEEILDKDILIKGIKTRPSSFYEGDYAIIQVEKDGKLYVVTTSSSVLMDQINKIESKIPFRCRITKRKNPATNRRYYIIVPIR